MNIRRTGMGIEVSIPFKTDLGTDREVLVTYSQYGLNPTAPGALNLEGVRALRQALTLAEILYEHKYLLE